jgi:hypothetical protein
VNEIPRPVLDIIDRAATRYGDDIPKAVTAAEKAIRKLPDFAELAGMFVRHAVQEMLYDSRHKTNTATRKAEGKYGGPGKVVAGASDAVGRAAESVYLYFIGGKTLGALRGDELPLIAESESAKATGHEFNARLCERLRPLVKDNKTVRESVSERKLRQIFHDTSEAA